MTTLVLKPGDRVLVVQRWHGRDLVHNGLVLGVSMNELLAGARGGAAVHAVIARPDTWADYELPAVALPDLVHISHPQWLSGLAGFAYESLPPQSGVCMFCGCTERRACMDDDGTACSWIDVERTVCSSAACLEKATEVDAFVRSLVVEPF